MGLLLRPDLLRHPRRASVPGLPSSDIRESLGEGVSVVVEGLISRGLQGWRSNNLVTDKGSPRWKIGFLGVWEAVSGVSKKVPILTACPWDWVRGLGDFSL